jgi:hypothetical protein
MGHRQLCKRQVPPTCVWLHKGPDIADAGLSLLPGLDENNKHVDARDHCPGFDSYRSAICLPVKRTSFSYRLVCGCKVPAIKPNCVNSIENSNANNCGSQMLHVCSLGRMSAAILTKEN